MADGSLDPQFVEEVVQREPDAAATLVSEQAAANVPPAQRLSVGEAVALGVTTQRAEPGALREIPRPPRRPPQPAAQPPSPEQAQYDPALFEQLRTWRMGAAEQAGQKAFYVFPNATLKRIAAARPQTMDELGAVKGVGPAKLRQYGQAVLDITRGTREESGALSAARNRHRNQGARGMKQTRFRISAAIAILSIVLSLAVVGAAGCRPGPDAAARPLRAGRAEPALDRQRRDAGAVLLPRRRPGQGPLPGQGRALVRRPHPQPGPPGGHGADRRAGGRGLPGRRRRPRAAGVADHLPGAGHGGRGHHHRQQPGGVQHGPDLRAVRRGDPLSDAHGHEHTSAYRHTDANPAPTPTPTANPHPGADRHPGQAAHQLFRYSRPHKRARRVRHPALVGGAGQRGLPGLPQRQPGGGHRPGGAAGVPPPDEHLRPQGPGPRRRRDGRGAGQRRPADAHADRDANQVGRRRRRLPERQGHRPRRRLRGREPQRGLRPAGGRPGRARRL